MWAFLCLGFLGFRCFWGFLLLLNGLCIAITIIVETIWQILTEETSAQNVKHLPYGFDYTAGNTVGSYFYSTLTVALLLEKQHGQHKARVSTHQFFPLGSTM